MGSVTALVGAAGALAGSLAAAAGGLGALGVAAAGVAVPGLALVGGVIGRLTEITKAYKQQETQSTQSSITSAAAAQQHAASAEALRSAKLGVKIATEQVTQAETQEKTARAEARKGIQDATATEKQAADAVVWANKRVEQARKDATKAERDAALAVRQTAADLQSARLGVQGAEQRAKDLRLQGKMGTFEYAQAQSDLTQAHLGATSAQNAHNDALAQQKRFATEGARAYKPYVDALHSADLAQTRLAKATDNLERLQKRGISGAPAVIAAQQTFATRTSSSPRPSTGSTSPSRTWRRATLLQRCRPVEFARRAAFSARSGRSSASCTPPRRPGSPFSGGATDAVFKGMGAGLSSLTGMLPKLKDSFTGLGQEVGRQFAAMGKHFASPEWTKGFEALTKGATSMTRILGPGFQRFADILKNVALAAMPSLVRLTGDFVRWLGKVDDWSKTASFQRTIRNMVGQFESWMRLLGAVSRLLVTVFVGGANQGKNLVDTLTRVVNRWNAWLNTGKGQRDMQQFFKDSVTVTKQLASALAPIVKLFAQALVAALKFTRSLPPGMREIATIGVAIGALAMWKKGIYGVAETGVRGVLRLFRALAATDAGAKAVEAITGASGLGGLQKRASGPLSRFGTAVSSRLGGIGRLAGLAFAVGFVAFASDALTKFIDSSKGDSGGGKVAVRKKITGAGAGVGTTHPPTALEYLKDLIPGLASGGEVVSGGAAVVGERGPELALLPTGTRIVPNHRLGQTMALADPLDKERKRTEPVVKKLRDLLGTIPTEGQKSSKKTAKDVHDELDKGGKDWHKNLTATKDKLLDRFEDLRKDGTDKTKRLATGVADRFNDMRKDAGKAAQGLAHSVGGHMEDARKAASQKSSQARSQVADHYNGMRTDVSKAVSTVAKTTASGLDDAKTGASKGAKGVRSVVAASYSSMQDAVHTGLGYVQTATSNALSGLGGKPVHLSVPKPKGLALGGFIGAPGESGADSELYMLGRGEAVLNRHQQGAVNSMLGYFGVGLNDVIDSIQRPHYAAKGKPGNAAKGKPGKSDKYVFPFPGFSFAGVDMGTDWSGKGPILAIGDGVVTRAAPQNSGTGWPGQGDGGRGNRGAMIVYRLTSGPKSGNYVYTAENIDPRVKQGQHIKAGQIIANARGAFPFLEEGWAVDAHGTPVAHNSQAG